MENRTKNSVSPSVPVFWIVATSHWSLFLARWVDTHNQYSLSESFKSRCRHDVPLSLNTPGYVSPKLEFSPTSAQYGRSIESLQISELAAKCFIFIFGPESNLGAHISWKWHIRFFSFHLPQFFHLSCPWWLWKWHAFYSVDFRDLNLDPSDVSSCLTQVVRFCWVHQRNATLL